MPLKRHKQLQNLSRNLTTIFTNNNGQTYNSNLKCFSCSSNNLTNKSVKPLSKQKSHYTIRRGPGKISHLLIPQRIDMILANSNVSTNVSREFKSQNNSSQEENLESFDNNNSNNNKNSLSDLCKLNRTTSLTFDVNLFIDEEESQQDVYHNNSSNNNNTNLKNDKNAMTFKRDSLSNDDKYSLRSNDLAKTSIVDNHDSNHEFSNKYYDRKNIILSN